MFWKFQQSKCQVAYEYGMDLDNIWCWFQQFSHQESALQTLNFSMIIYMKKDKLSDLNYFRTARARTIGT